MFSMCFCQARSSAGPTQAHISLIANSAFVLKELFPAGNTVYTTRLPGRDDWSLRCAKPLIVLYSINSRGLVMISGNVLIMLLGVFVVFCVIGLLRGHFNSRKKL